MMIPTSHFEDTMNQGARDANDEARHRAERKTAHNTLAAIERVEALLGDMLDVLRWHFRDDPRPEPASPSKP